MIRQTSIMAYLEMIDKINYRQYQIICGLRHFGSANNTMIARYLNLPINCVTPRVRELYKKGLILIDEYNICPYTHKKTIFWKLSERRNLN